MGRYLILLLLVCSPLCGEELPEFVTQWQPNVCRVTASFGNGTANKGSGCHVGNGWVVTADHVTRGVTKVTLDFYNGPTVQGEVRGYNRTCDVSYIKCDVDLSGVPFAMVEPAVGDTVYKAGYGRDGRLFWHKCKVVGEGLNSDLEPSWLKITPYSISGDSGGPVFDKTGRYVGDLWGSSPGENTTTVVKAAYVQSHFGGIKDKLIEYHVGIFGKKCYQYPGSPYT